ncbi:CHAP domain-containing protein [Candidatus Saccharibacteria bacterium]|nr:CHAP domain-containing protein [Candidatus Saccharibacteria bacterium]
MSEAGKQIFKKVGTFLLTAGAIIGYLVLGYAVEVTIHPPVEKTEVGINSTLELSETQPETPVEVIENGEAKTIDVVTVDEVDGGKMPTENDGKTKEELNLGQGAYYDPTTPKTWIDATYGKCIDLDGYFGSQCVDYFAAFTIQEYGRWPSTNGTGAAYGLWDAREYNAGEDMLLVYNKNEIPVGTWAVFNGGLYGHVGLVLGYVDENHVLLAGENQGGAACQGGGAAANIISMSLDNFRGGFLPKRWYVEPEPEPTPAPVEGNYVYVLGDTFGQVLLDNGYATENGLWGKDGDVQYYNAQLFEQGILNFYDGKYWNNIPVGTEIKLEHR